MTLGEALQPEFKQYARNIIANCATMGEAMVEGGLRLVSGGTDNHLCLVDLTPANVTGADTQEMLETVGITVNKNTVPFETRSPFVTSGVRLGTPALTTRGMKSDDMRKVAKWIVAILENLDNESRLTEIRLEVEKFAGQFPLFAW